jgi:hypothetical protein
MLLVLKDEIGTWGTTSSSKVMILARAEPWDGQVCMLSRALIAIKHLKEKQVRKNRCVQIDNEQGFAVPVVQLWPK